MHHYDALRACVTACIARLIYTCLLDIPLSRLMKHAHLNSNRFVQIIYNLIPSPRVCIPRIASDAILSRKIADTIRVARARDALLARNLRTATSAIVNDCVCGAFIGGLYTI